MDYKNTDWMGKWYLLKEERGENYMLSMGRGEAIDPSGEVINREYWDIHHGDMDGSAAMAVNLQKLGVVDAEPFYIKRRKQPNLLGHIEAILRALKIKPNEIPHWAKRDEDKKSGIHDYAVLSLSPNETLKLKERAKEMNVGINAMILYELKQIAYDLSSDSDYYQFWLFPVNMRGAVKKQNIYSNIASLLPIKIGSEDSPLSLHQQIREQLQNNIHWGNWWLYNLGILFGLKGMRKIAHEDVQKTFWTGTYSDMGEWEVSDRYQSLSDSEVWFCVPPGGKNHPLGFVKLTFNGRMTFGFKIDPYVCDKPVEIANNLLKAMKKSLVGS